jgi:hypothetical protein
MSYDEGYPSGPLDTMAESDVVTGRYVRYRSRIEP